MRTAQLKKIIKQIIKQSMSISQIDFDCIVDIQQYLLDHKYVTADDQYDDYRYIRIELDNPLSTGREQQLKEFLVDKYDYYFNYIHIEYTTITFELKHPVYQYDITSDLVLDVEYFQLLITNVLPRLQKDIKNFK